MVVIRTPRGLVLVVLVGSLLGILVLLPPVSADLPNQPSDEVTRGEPDFDLILEEPEVTPGDEAVIELELQNDGELESGGTNPENEGRVLTARGVTTNISDTGPFNVSTNEAAGGQVPDGETLPVAKQLEVPESLEPGEYDIEVTVDYSYVEAVSEITGNARKESKTQTFDVTVVVPEEPRFEVTVLDTDAQPGDVGDTKIEIENYGAETAYDARASMAGGSGVSIEGASPDAPAEFAFGDLAPGETTTVTVSTTVDESASEELRAIDVELNYEDEQGIEQEPRSERLNLAPAGEQAFAVGDVESTLQVGEDGDIRGVVTNTGPRTAQNVQVAYTDESGTMVPIEDQVLVGSLEPGEEESFRLPVEVTPDAEATDRAVDVAVQYRNEDFEQRSYEDVELTTDVLEEQRFDLGDVESTLQVGEDGDIHGVVTNTGPRTAQNVQLVYADESDNIVPIESRVLVGSLEPGEEESFRLPVEVSREAEAIDRAVDVTVQYRNADLEHRSYEDVELTTTVLEQRDEFIVDVQDREIEAGETKLVDVEVTNNLDQTVSDVEARLFADDPLDSDDDEAFVESLEAGESTTMTFELEAESSATAKTYPISFDFRYDDERDRSQMSDTTRVAIDVVDGEGGFPVSTVVVGSLALAGLGAVGYAYRQRQS